MTGMTGMTVVRWARFGKERLYVNADDGTRVGWHDLVTETSTIEQPAFADAFHAAIAAHLGSPVAEIDLSTLPPPTLPSPFTPPLSSTSPPPSTLPPPSALAPPVPTAPEVPAAEAHATAAPSMGGRPEPPGWEDLTHRVAGKAAREQAQVHLARMKERSRVGTFIARTLDMKTDERAWRVGADGEETVGARLEKLTKHGWHVLHAVPVGERGSDIDHVIIGPAGVYTINTKTHPGKRIWVSPHQIRVDGQVVPYLRNSRHEADRARRLLAAALGWEPPVRPALVLLTGTFTPQITVKSGGPDDVEILGRTDIPRAFRRAKRTLTDEGVAEVFEVARRSTTWTLRPRGE